MISANPIENKGIAMIYFALKPKEIEITAPKLAPLEIPTIPESTMGFLSKLCIVQPQRARPPPTITRSEEHTSELQSRQYLVCRLLLEKKNVERVDLVDAMQITIEPRVGAS